MSNPTDIVYSNTDVAGSDLTCRKTDYQHFTFRNTGQEQNLTQAQMGEFICWALDKAAYLDENQKKLLAKYADNDDLLHNIQVLSDMADTILAYHASPNYIGNQQGVDEIIHNAKAQLK